MKSKKNVFLMEKFVLLILCVLLVSCTNQTQVKDSMIYHADEFETLPLNFVETSKEQLGIELSQIEEIDFYQDIENKKDVRIQLLDAKEDHILYCVNTLREDKRGAQVGTQKTLYLKTYNFKTKENNIVYDFSDKEQIIHQALFTKDGYVMTMVDLEKKPYESFNCSINFLKNGQLQMLNVSKTSFFTTNIVSLAKVNGHIICVVPDFEEVAQKEEPRVKELVLKQTRFYKLGGDALKEITYEIPKNFKNELSFLISDGKQFVTFWEDENGLGKFVVCDEERVKYIVALEELNFNINDFITSDRNLLMSTSTYEEDADGIKKLKKTEFVMMDVDKKTKFVAEFDPIYFFTGILQKDVVTALGRDAYIFKKKDADIEVVKLFDFQEQMQYSANESKLLPLGEHDFILLAAKQNYDGDGFEYELYQFVIQK